MCSFGLAGKAFSKPIYQSINQSIKHSITSFQHYGWVCSGRSCILSSKPLYPEPALLKMARSLAYPNPIWCLAFVKSDLSIMIIMNKDGQVESSDYLWHAKDQGYTCIDKKHICNMLSSAARG